jgi:hypothetical protein
LCFDNAHDDIKASLLQHMGVIEHGKSFTDTRRVANKYLQSSLLDIIFFHFFQKGIGIRP